MITRALAVAVVLCTTCGNAIAQNAPAAGLAAEAAGRWSEAIAAYREAIARDPRRADLWARIATIESHLDDPAAALTAMDAALVIEPANAEYLRAGAVLATWQGAYALAADRYRSLLALSPSDEKARLGLARVTAWSGATDDAVDAYRRYLRAHADAGDVWLELARTESWRGNDAAALDALSSYRALAGSDPTTYSRELAAALTHASRPARAIDLIATLLPREPDAIDLLSLRSIALALAGRTRDARAALDALQRAHGGSREAREAAATVRAAIGSTVQPTASVYSDSDRLTVQRYAASASIVAAGDTRIVGGYERARLDAPVSSGLGRRDGRAATFDQASAGASQRISALTVEGRIGSARADDRSRTVYQLNATIRASDTVRLVIEQTSNFFVVSPRTIELGLTSVRDRAAIAWSPSLRTHVSLDAAVDRLSDGNTRWEITAVPHAAVARTQRLNVDAGGTAYVLVAAKDLSDGYYQPRRYESYQAALFPYFKISENAGLGLTLTAGPQRDDAEGGFRFGGNASAEATVGIYRPWVLAVRATATNNRRGDTGAFHGYGGSIALTRRF